MSGRLWGELVMHRYQLGALLFQTMAKCHGLTCLLSGNIVSETN